MTVRLGVHAISSARSYPRASVRSLHVVLRQQPARPVTKVNGMHLVNFWHLRQAPLLPFFRFNKKSLSCCKSRRMQSFCTSTKMSKESTLHAKNKLSYAHLHLTPSLFLFLSLCLSVTYIQYQLTSMAMKTSSAMAQSIPLAHALIKLL